MKAEFNASKLAKNQVMTITIKGIGVFKARLFVAKLLFYLGTFILGCGLNIEET